MSERAKSRSLRSQTPSANSSEDRQERGDASTTSAQQDHERDSPALDGLLPGHRVPLEQRQVRTRWPSTRSRTRSPSTGIAPTPASMTAFSTIRAEHDLRHAAAATPCQSMQQREDRRRRCRRCPGQSPSDRIEAERDLGAGNAERAVEQIRAQRRSDSSRADGSGRDMRTSQSEPRSAPSPRVRDTKFCCA